MKNKTFVFFEVMLKDDFDHLPNNAFICKNIQKIELK